MSYTALSYHIVFSVKQRRRLILPGLLTNLQQYIGGIIRNLGGHALAINGPEDHLHVLSELPPTLAVSDFVRDIKANSSAWMGKQVPRFSWQSEYSAFTVSRSSVERVRAYVLDQQEHHKRMSFNEELCGLLDRHGVQYEPKYL